MKVYVMTSEHYSVPGVITRVCATRDLAVREALTCVNIMLRDCGRPEVTTETAMDAAVSLLQEEHGGAHCYAEITEHKVIDVKPWAERSPRWWSLIMRINGMAAAEGWCLCVGGDGMVVIDTDHDAVNPQPDAHSFVMAMTSPGCGMLHHYIALGLHGMIMTEEH